MRGNRHHPVLRSCESCLRSRTSSGCCPLAARQGNRGIYRRVRLAGSEAASGALAAARPMQDEGNGRGRSWALQLSSLGIGAICRSSSKGHGGERKSEREGENSERERKGGEG